MDRNDERHPGGAAPAPTGPVAIVGPARTGTRGPRTSVSATAAPALARHPVPARGRRRSRQTLATAAAVCVIAASLAVVGWVRSNAGAPVPPGGRYAVVDTPPGAPGSPPPGIGVAPQPLVPLLPPDRRTGKSPTRPAPAKPSNRAATPRPATPVVTGPAGVISGYAGKCLHIPGDAPVDGVPVDMTACDGGPGERWTMASDGTVRAFGKCLDAAGGQVADGTTVQLSACQGSAGQQWRFTAGRDLVNPHADKCLDVKDFNPGDRAPLQIWTCTGSANQKWSAPA